MSFGIVLKNVRKQNGDSLRGLADKINLAFTFIDKVEKGLNPPSENMITRLLKVYPLQKKYCQRHMLKMNYLKMY